MEYQRAVYDFCPVCGGLMKNGVCMSCGYVEKEETISQTKTGADVAADSTDGRKTENLDTAADGAYDREAEPFDADGIPAPGMEWRPEQDVLKKEWSPIPDTAGREKHTGFLAGMGGFGAVFIMLLLLAFSMIARDVRSGAFAWREKPPEINAQDFFSQLESEEGDDGTFQIEGLPKLPDIAGLKEKLEELEEAQKKVENALEKDLQPHRMEEGKASDYVPQPTDVYYTEIVDALREDLFYQIEWKTYEMEKEDGSASYYAVYPQLAGELPRREELNAFLEEQAVCYEDLTAQGGYSELLAESVSYVTYMDEKLLSIVMREQLKVNGYPVQRLYDINIDLVTGTVLEHQDILAYSAELAEEFRSRNLSQNGREMPGDVWTTGLLTKQLGGEDGILFFTPAGLEIGVNYSTDISKESGWATVTLKAYEKYRKTP